MARIRINTKTHAKERPYLINSYFFFKIGKAKKAIGWANTCTYVFEICAEVIFVTFPWWLENVKSMSKIAIFSNERHFEIWFPKKRTITFFWGKLSKLNKKDPILHVATIFSLKQGETRTSHGPIPHTLNHSLSNQILKYNLLFGMKQTNRVHPGSFQEIQTFWHWYLIFFRHSLVGRILKWKLFYIKQSEWGHLGSFLDIQNFFDLNI